MNKPKITLDAWARQHYDPPPSIRTLRRWAKSGYIQPQPQKAGRIYMVDPDAQYIKQTAQVVMLPTSEVSSVPLSERALKVFHGQSTSNG